MAGAAFERLPESTNERRKSESFCAVFLSAGGRKL